MSDIADRLDEMIECFASDSMVTRDSIIDLLEDARNAIADLKANLAAAESRPAVPAGWKLVPVEPTDEMIDAGADAIDGYRVDVMRAYEAMVTAAGESHE